MALNDALTLFERSKSNQWTVVITASKNHQQGVSL